MPRARGALALRIFVLISSGYFLSYGLRSINATIAPEMVGELRLQNTELGALTSAYFLTFALLQLPVGVWLDRFGARRVNASLMLIAAVGCAVFAMAGGFAGLWLGRALIGIGFAAALMAPYALFRAWFAPEHQTRWAAWTMMIGSAGALCATLPVRMAIEVMSWRGVFWVCAVALLGLAAAMWWGIPREREPVGASRASFGALLGGYGQIGRNRFFWRMALLAIVVQGGFVALQTLWVGPWFTRVLGLSPDTAAVALFVFNAALLGGFLLSGSLAPRLGQTETAALRLAGTVAASGLVILLLVATLPALAGVWAWLFLALGFAFFTPIQARVGMAFPAALAGRALTSFNLIIFVSAFTLQTGLGLLLDALIGRGWSEPQAFRAGVGVLAGVQALALLGFIAGPWQAPRAEGTARSRTGSD